jgi:hypothetical protein
MGEQCAAVKNGGREKTRIQRPVAHPLLDSSNTGQLHLQIHGIDPWRTQKDDSNARKSAGSILMFRLSIDSLRHSILLAVLLVTYSFLVALDSPPLYSEAPRSGVHLIVCEGGGKGGWHLLVHVAAPHPRIILRVAPNVIGCVSLFALYLFIVGACLEERCR